MRELVGGKNTIGRTAAVLIKPHKATFNLLPETVLIHFVSPDDEHDVLEICREL